MDKDDECKDICVAPWTCSSCPIYPEGKRYRAKGGKWIECPTCGHQEWKWN